MALWLALILFVLGIILVMKGGDWFVDAASWIARAAGIPSFIIGATIVSIATTMPEMIVSVIAAAQGKTDMAIGNAVGSVTANTALIMAVAMIFMTVTISRKQYLKPCLLLIGASAVLWLGSLYGELKVWASLILAVIFIWFMYQNLQQAKGERSNGSREPVEKDQTGKNVLLFLAGAACIVIGSQCLVNGGSAIAAALGVPERVIAVTLVAIGTSLPELVTTLTAIRKKESNLSIGNIIGANIIDLTLILPICSLVSGQALPVSAASIRYDLPACLLVTVLALVPTLWKERATKAQGILLLAVYIAYLIVTV
jgi:cation:H+ antiporter